MVTIADILWRENKMSTVCNAKKMYTLLNNDASRRSMGNKTHAVTRRATMRRSSGINKKMTKKKIIKSLMSLKRYIMTSFLWI